MIQITKVIEDAKEQLNNKKQEMLKLRFVANLRPEQFKELFVIIATGIIANRRIDREFKINNQNHEILKQLYLYLTCNTNFKGELNKGILLAGKNGVGKTVIMLTFIEIVKILCRISIRHYHAKEISPIVAKDGYEDLRQRPLFIDDIGKEQREIMIYGTRLQPISDLIALRYDNGSLTYATSNYSLETLQEFYGITTTERFKEMFNTFVVEGESYR